MSNNTFSTWKLRGKLETLYCAGLLDLLEFERGVHDLCDASEVCILHDLFVQRHRVLLEELLEL